ncbi:MAG: hypothetical protein AAB578_01345 [Elusimicrobiota bacterium]
MTNTILAARPPRRAAVAAVVVAAGLFAMAGKVHAAEAKASSDTVRLVEHFLGVPTIELPPEGVPEFLEVDAKTLPKKLRTPYQAKKEELLALKKIVDGKKKGTVRRQGVEPIGKCGFENTDEAGLGIYSLAGYGPITEEEEAYLMKKTGCTECELADEFSLKLMSVKSKVKGRKPRTVYLLHAKDPLQVFVGLYRQGAEAPEGTNFFGVSPNPKCR